MKPIPATDRQLEVLRAIVAHQEKHGHSPTNRELCKPLGVTLTAVVDHLRAIRSKGLVDWKSMHARTLALTPRGWAELGVARRREKLAEVEEDLAQLQAVAKASPEEVQDLLRARLQTLRRRQEGGR